VSDERLRDLERRWKETGAVDDEAAWLKERVRVGDLSQVGLVVAAHLGHSGALVATGTKRADLDFSRDEEDEEGNRRLLQPWATALLHTSPQGARRALIAGAYASLPFFETWLDSDLPRRAVEAAETLVMSGGAPREGLSELVAAVFGVCPDRGYGAPPEDTDRGESAATAAALALRLCLTDKVQEQHVFEGLCCADRALSWSRFEYSRSQPCDWSPAKASPVSSAAVVELVREEVVPWALGIHDPVAARVMAQQE
jgi:hypothetical protein